MRDKLVWQNYPVRVIGLLTKGRDCKPSWNCWHRHSSRQSGVFIFCRRTVGVKYQFVLTAGVLWKVDTIEIQLKRALSTWRPRSGLVHLSVVLNQEINILLIIKPVYLFDLSCYRIIGEKKRWVRGLHTASCHGNLRDSRDEKSFVPSQGLIDPIYFAVQKLVGNGRFCGNKKRQKSKLRDTETFFSCN